MTQPEPITPPAEPAAPQVAAPAPPWGTDENFDPAKAWALVQNLRGDLATKNGRIAELTPFEQKAREAEEASKSEVQRATDALTVAERRALAAEEALLRRDVADEKGLTPAQAKRLVGKTREELLADADDFLASLPQPLAAAATSRTPVEALRPGALPQVPALTLGEQIAAAEKAKDWKTAMSLKSQQVVALTESQK